MKIPNGNLTIVCMNLNTKQWFLIQLVMDKEGGGVCSLKLVGTKNILR